jgi:outer membrane PBP1 activator LpoA protein
LTLLQSLENVPSGELALRAVNPRTDQILTGWLDLALTIRQNLVNPDELPQAMRSWKGRHPQHFLSENDGLDLWLRYRQQFPVPQKVAVLLPESGRLQAAAEAIRDGILSAFISNPNGAELVFLSTGEEGELTASAYFEARELGADWIIGPLEKPSIEALINLAGLVTPLLALNELPPEFNTPPGLSDHLYGLSFSQEEEVRSLAREVMRTGFRRALILAPESDWGERMAQSFRDEFLRDDHQIIASSRYLESDNDHSAILERMLKIDESKAREKSLENTLQLKLEFEPVRRSDIDVIFLAAGSKQGRLIRPQLRFNFAGDIPVYAAGRIFDGQPNPIADQDLNGVRFPTTPLEIGFDPDNPMAALTSLRNGVFANLYALGRDAWGLLPWLDLMRRDPDFRFPGASGFYYIGPSGKLLREPAFAIFSGGRPAPLNRYSGIAAKD